MLEPVQTDFKQHLGEEMETDIIKDSWRITVTVSPEKIYIVHTNKEQGSIHRFEIKWELTTSIFLTNPALLDDIHFQVCFLLDHIFYFFRKKVSKYFHQRRLE